MCSTAVKVHEMGVGCAPAKRCDDPTNRKPTENVLDEPPNDTFDREKVEGKRTVDEKVVRTLATLSDFNVSLGADIK